jgi:uncharacterized protein YcgI (DUF1989 family)
MVFLAIQLYAETNKFVVLSACNRGKDDSMLRLLRKKK